MAAEAPAQAAKRPRAPVGPVLGTVVPRFAGAGTFCRLPELRDVVTADVAYLGVPFDGGCSFRPGARFGPSAIRQASRNLRTQWHPAYQAAPYTDYQAADAGDVSCNPFCIGDALTQARRHAVTQGLAGPADAAACRCSPQIQATADDVLTRAKALVCLGGDHTIALPLLRSVRPRGSGVT